MTSQTRLPIVLDVPFAATIVGFRPTRLPPLFEGFRGVRIAHIQSNHWADRAGLKVGDVITHVNGKAVIDMNRADEFTDAMKERPLRITVDIPVSADELSDVIGKYDWSARMDEVRKAQQAKELVAGETSQVYETVFKPTIPKDEKSPLFDATKWINARPSRVPPALTAPADDPPLPVPQAVLPVPTVTIMEKKEVPKKPPTPPPKPKPKPQKKPNPFKTSRELSSVVTSKWVPNRPLRVQVKVDAGTDIPVKAGTLGLDFLAQPFSSDPYIELSLCAPLSTGADVTLDALLNAAPINNQKIDTPVCDAQMRWNFSHTFDVSDSLKGPDDVVLVGKLYDYRRLAAAKLMGVFAIKLSAVDVGDSIDKGKLRLISLTSADPFVFDVRNTKIKMTIVLEGRFAQVTEAASKEVDEVLTIESGISTPDDIDVIESSQEVTNPSGSDNKPSGDQATSNYIPPPEPLKLVYSSPFQRALQNAKDQIRLGDFSPLRSQRYSIR
jgi:hypothetical protein